MNTILSVGMTVTVLAASLLLGGCTTTSAGTPQEEKAPGQAIEKSGDTTLSGTLVKLDRKYYLKLSGKPNQEVDSYGVDLSIYEGKTVTIIGQFSGTTLFAGRVEANQ